MFDQQLLLGMSRLAHSGKIPMKCRSSQGGWHFYEISTSPAQRFTSSIAHMDVLLHTTEAEFFCGIYQLSTRLGSTVVPR